MVQRIVQNQKIRKLIVVNLHDDGYSKRMNEIIASKSYHLSEQNIFKTRKGIKESPDLDINLYRYTSPRSPSKNL